MPELASEEMTATTGETIPAPAMPWSHDGSKAEEPAGILFQGIVYGGTGYAEECWVVAVALAEAGLPVQLAPIGWGDDIQKLLPGRARRTLARLARERVNLPQSILYQHAMAYLWNMEAYGKLRVGRTMFETDRIPDGWKERCNALDEVWVASEFNRETFTASGVDPRKLRVLHAGVDTDLFRPGVQPLNLPHRRRFNFLSVFDLQPRKGSDLLLRAYLTEFKPDDDVALVLKISQHSDPQMDPEAQLAYFIEHEVGLRLEETPPVILLNGYLTQAEMAGLYAAADAFVLPTHGEGYGRPLLEAMSCELPVIATAWGGQMDFMTSDNSYLLDSEGLVPASVEEEIFAGHLWAQPSVDHLRQLMREVVSRPEEARRHGQRARQDMVANWDWSVVAPRWVNEFRRLME
jgi:glycosyltransferase involved in cell wall biosynthesis